MVNKVMLKHRINHQRYDVLICRIVKVSVLLSAPDSISFLAPPLHTNGVDFIKHVLIIMCSTQNKQPVVFRLRMFPSFPGTNLPLCLNHQSRLTTEPRHPPSSPHEQSPSIWKQFSSLFFFFLQSFLLTWRRCLAACSWTSRTSLIRAVH